MEKLSKEALLALLAEKDILLVKQGTLLAEKDTKISFLEERMLSLEKQLGELSVIVGHYEFLKGQNSQNTSKSPSTDLYKKVTAPRKTGGKRGGQEGHKGNTLKMTATPDEEIIHLPETCGHCGEKLDSATLTVELLDEKRQVIDIIPAVVKVTEHRIGKTSCTCGKTVVGAFPKNVNQPTQYGSQLKSEWVYWNTACNLSIGKIEDLTKKQYGINVNVATIHNTVSACAKLLEPTMELIREEVSKSTTVHFDETGARTAAKNYWVHTASTLRHTFMFGHAKRGHEAMDSEKSVVKDFKGNAVIDCYSSYQKYEFNPCYCGAHLLRELYSAEENGAAWAGEMSRLLLDLKEETAQNDGTVKDIEKAKQAYEKIISSGLSEQEQRAKAENAKERKTALKKSNALIKRMKKKQVGILAFTRSPDIPFTNNLAERDIRCLKTKLKVSTSFRTPEGLNTFATINSFISTLKKQSKDALSHLKAIFDGSFTLDTIR